MARLGRFLLVSDNIGIASGSALILSAVTGTLLKTDAIHSEITMHLNQETDSGTSNTVITDVQLAVGLLQVTSSFGFPAGPTTGSLMGIFSIGR